MKSRRTILRVGITTILGVVLTVPALAKAATPVPTFTQATSTDVLITEVQAASAASASEEFVEFYNNTNADINFGDTKDAWKLQYFSSTKFTTLIGSTETTTGWTAPTRTINLTGVIHAHDYYVMAAGTYARGNIQPDQTYTATLADEGAVQLVDLPTATSTVYHDRVLWSNDAKWPTGHPLVPAPEHGASAQRIPNDNTEYVNGDGSLTPFAVKPDISPESPWLAPVVTEPETPPTPETPPEDDGSDTPAPSADPPVTNDGLMAPLLTEILPNPASPQTDDADEFIELYNPNDSPFNLKGFTLETGETTLHDFTFTSDTLLLPNSYQAFSSAQTNLSLSNSGGQTRLLDPAGVSLSQTSAYGAANDGQAWAFSQSDNTWRWTTTPTPNDTNVFTEPVVVAKTTTAKQATVKKATIKTASAKVKGASTTKAKKPAAAKKTKATSTKTQTSAATVSKPVAPIHTGVLAAVAALAVAYGIYEYRHDLANRIYQFRTNRAARRSARR